MSEITSIQISKKLRDELSEYIEQHGLRSYEYLIRKEHEAYIRKR